MEPNSPEKPGPFPPTAGGARPLRILVVDDEPSVLHIIEQHLTADGHEVHTAPNGILALERFVGEAWDLVLTDRVMPGMNGDELAEAIKRIDRSMPVVLVTAFAERPPDPEREQSPFDLTIRKPFTRETLRAALNFVAGRTVSPRRAA